MNVKRPKASGYIYKLIFWNWKYHATCMNF